jgi:hypothetical protein
MNSMKRSVSILALLGTSFSSWPALADIPPEDQCLATDAGKACDNAVGPDDELKPGVCTATTCTRATPDGAMTYACYRCVATVGGTGGAPNEPVGGAAGASEPTPSGGSNPEPTAGKSSGGSTAGGTTTAGGSSVAGAGSGSKKHDDSGCSVSPIGAVSSAGGLLLALGIVSASVARRRSRRS